MSQDIKGKRILVAEDNELNAEITLTVLRERGLLAERVRNGKECVEMLIKMPDAGMNTHVSKPVDVNVLFRVMAKILKNS